MKESIENFFEFERNETNLKTEVLAGITTFLATAYIIIVNPQILSQSGLSFNAVLTATIIVTFFSSAMMGLYAKNPIVLAPGMGINAFFTYSIVLGMGVSPYVALGAIFWSGVFFLLMSIFNIREIIVKAIPRNLRLSIATGIGFFIALIGLINGGIVVDNPATLISAAKLDANVALFFVSLLFISILSYFKIGGALVIGILFSALGYHLLNDVKVGANLFSSPDFSLLGKLDFTNSLAPGLIHVIFSLIFTDLFDSLSTFVAVSEAGNLKDRNGEPRNLKKSLLVDSMATLISGIFGTSSATSYIESGAGISQGGKSGLVALIAGFLFLPFLFLSPALSLFPSFSTAPVLVFVGLLMSRSITMINFKDLDEALPAFLSMMLIPLTYSIGQGIIWGFLSYTVLKIALGKKNEVSLGLIIIDIFCLLSLLMK